jgi:hypothetical protein
MAFMKLLTTIFALFLAFNLPAQVSFKTIVSKQTITAGESFQVQYTLSNAEKTGSFIAPAFTGFRLINGPHIYTGTEQGGNGETQLQNYVFALEAIKPGRFIIPGAAVTVNGKPVRSNAAVIEVIPASAARPIEAGAGDQSLLPGEDPYEKIRQNLFLKLIVDRRSCFVGEPVLATFKLYSRLESKSDIVKNPGFYGFTVYDMVNLADQQSATETINGKVFEVHTVRQVQLYPLRPGRFVIDAMEVKNEISFSKSIVNKKTEQEITEGVHKTSESRPENVYENSISTAPVSIHVKPVPEKSKPAQYSGACGDFKMVAVPVNTQLAKNEQGFLDIVISGKGNFTQLNAPEISWPAGMEGFEPSTTDSLDKYNVPLQGKRVFRFPFISSAPGIYQLPVVSLHFFHPASGGYKTVSSAPVSVTISNETKKQDIVLEKKENIRDVNARASKLAFIIILSLMAAGLGYWIFYKKKPAPKQEEKKVELPSADEVLLPAGELIKATNKAFLGQLYNCMWGGLGKWLEMKQGTASKEGVYEKLREKKLPEEHILRLQQFYETCETAMFTSVAMDIDKEALLKDAKEIIEEIRKLLL